MLERPVLCSALLVVATLSALAQPNRPAVSSRADFQISGTLVDSNTGQPIARARVAIAPVTERDNFSTMFTQEDGRFAFPRLMPGKYTLSAQARGYLLQSFNQHDQFSSSIVVGPDLDSANLLFRLPPEGAISGVVADEAGEPVRDAQVMLYSTGLSGGSEATRRRAATMTNDEGAYHFGHLAPGRYLVAVSARPWYAQHSILHASGGTASGDAPVNPQLDVAYPVTFFPGVTEAEAAAPLVVGRGEKLSADLNLQPVAALHIRVPRDPDAERPTRIALEKRVLDGPPIQIGEQISNHENDREIVGLPPGHYTMRTFSLGRDGGNDSTLAREIDVGNNGEINNAKASSYVPLSAKVEFNAGTSVGQVSLQLLNKRTREVLSERVGNGGELAFKQGVLPGSYEVSLASSSGFYLRSLSATGATVTGRTIDIRPGNTVTLAIGATIGEGQITGTALRLDKPVAGAMIVLVPADPAHNQVLYRRDQSDSDGTFTLPAVVPGRYTVLAIGSGWDLEWTKPSVLSSYMTAGVVVEVQANGTYDVKVPVQ